MKRIPLSLSADYLAALSEYAGFDLSPENLKTRAGKAYIAKVAEIVSRISEGLTRDRTNFLASEYLKNKDIRKSYALYFMTTNLLKIHQPLRELEISGIFNRDSVRILDLGTGTGAAAWGLSSFFRDRNKFDLMLTDFLQENLEESKKFSKFFFKNRSYRPCIDYDIFDLKRLSDIPEKIREHAPYHLIMMMNVLNELPEHGDNALLAMIQSLLSSDGAILLIEPATRIESRRLLRFRDEAVKAGSTIFSPCTRQNGCPALEDEHNWCHSEAYWERPNFIKAIDEITGNLRLSLKYSYCIVRPDGLTLSKAMSKEHLYRTVSERFNEKGRIRAYLCGETGRDEYILNKRDRTPLNREFSATDRYDVAQIAGQEHREHDILLPKSAFYSIVLPNSGAR